MHDYNPTDVLVGKPDGQWHTVQKILDGNDQPKEANLALAGSEPDMDRFVYLARRGFRGVQRVTGTIATSGSGAIAGVIGQASVWQDFAAAEGLTPSITVADCKVGDILEAVFIGPFINEGTGTFGNVRLHAYQNPSVSTAIPETEVRIDAVIGSAFEVPQLVTLMGLVTITIAGNCKVQLQGMNQGSGSLYKIGLPDEYPYSLVVKRTRPFGI